MAVDKLIPHGIDSFEELILKANIALNNTGHYNPIYTVPAKIEQGQTYYFGAAIADTDITEEGLWQFRSTGKWKLIG